MGDPQSSSKESKFNVGVGAKRTKAPFLKGIRAALPSYLQDFKKTVVLDGEEREGEEGLMSCMMEGQGMIKTAAREHAFLESSEHTVFPFDQCRSMTISLLWHTVSQLCLAKKLIDHDETSPQDPY